MKAERNYPIEDGHRKHYAKHPCPDNEGKWYAAEIHMPEHGKKKGGYGVLQPWHVRFNTEQKCQKACNIHNEYHGWDDDDVVRLISISMGLKVVN